MSEKEMIAQQLEQEIQTTLKVLRSYPEDQLDLKPSEKSRTAKQLAWTLVNDIRAFSMAIDGQLDFSKAPPPRVEPPASLKEIVSALEGARNEITAKLKTLPEQQFQQNTFKGFVAPKQLGDVSINQFGWVTIKDHVHHRGQFSVYLRIAGGKLPSIYGPTADEPWM